MDQGKPLKVGKSQIGNFMEANVLMGWSTRRVEIYPSSLKNHQFFYGDTETETSENKIEIRHIHPTYFKVGPPLWKRNCLWRHYLIGFFEIDQLHQFPRFQIPLFFHIAFSNPTLDKIYNLPNIKQDPSSHPKYHVSIQNPKKKISNLKISPTAQRI